MNNYTLIENIGSGTFGVVHLAEKKDTKEQVVVKERSNKDSFS